jgi:putative nucleotidyltransferase with HDIG domain
MGDQTDKKRVLFVDDEQSLLQGLKRLLRKKTADWDMVFATSGAEALSLFNEAPFDIVISDLRMPVMNGAELLIQVQKHHPDTVRFILSGYADWDLILQTIGVAHQFLSKPCTTSDLVESITRAFSLRDLFNRTALLNIVRKSSSIPALPDVFMQLTAALRKPNTSLEQIAHIIETDIAISAKALQLVNSSFFGMSQHVDSVSTAVSLLGITMLQSIIIVVGVFDFYDEADIKRYKIREIYHHSLSLSHSAGNLMKNLTHDHKLIEQAMLAGMMHDLGKLAIINGNPEIWEEICAQEAKAERPQHEIEQELLGVTHAEIGAYLLGLWGLSDPVVEAVAYHHHPSKSLEQQLNVTAVLHIADVCHRKRHLDQGYCDTYDMAFLERIGALEKLETFERWCT